MVGSEVPLSTTEARRFFTGRIDLWLAAVALSRGLTLVTANLREFERVPGLVVEDWSVSRAG